MCDIAFDQLIRYGNGSCLPNTGEIAISGLSSEQVTAMAVAALEELKGVDITVIDIVGKSSIADAMLVATGTSQRHVRSLAENVRLSAKEAEHPPLGVEGDDRSDWVLVDLGDVIVHVMTQEKREFYALEKLWSVGPDSEASEAPAGAAGAPIHADALADDDALFAERGSRESDLEDDDVFMDAMNDVSPGGPGGDDSAGGEAPTTDSRSGSSR